MESRQTLINRILKGFDPEEHSLPSGFLLTSMTEMKGCGCKVPREILLGLLQGLEDEGIQRASGEIGIGLDSCVIPLRHKDLFLVQTTDFFYPLVDDPYIMGRVTCANVLSDLYAMGVVECDNMLILLGVPRNIEDSERDVIITNFFAGFKDTALEAGTAIRGGQTVRCPWLLLGGVGTTVCKSNEMAAIDSAVPGDVLVLTKPIGGQVAVNSYEWLKKRTGRVEELKLDSAKIVRAYQQVVEQMCRLNRNAARLMIKYGTHASTDVTGFGLLGHADNLAKAQKKNVHFLIRVMPIIEYMEEISKSMSGNGFGLFTGKSAETSGGLLIAMEREKAENFCKEIEELDGFPAWVVGEVLGEEDAALITGKSTRGATIADNVEKISIPSRIHKHPTIL